LLCCCLFFFHHLPLSLLSFVILRIISFSSPFPPFSFLHIHSRIPKRQSTRFIAEVQFHGHLCATVYRIMRNATSGIVVERVSLDGKEFGFKFSCNNLRRLLHSVRIRNNSLAFVIKRHATRGTERAFVDSPVRDMYTGDT
jgi:hypothetical protein